MNIYLEEDKNFNINRDIQLLGEIKHLNKIISFNLRLFKKNSISERFQFLKFHSLNIIFKKHAKNKYFKCLYRELLFLFNF